MDPQRLLVLRAVRRTGGVQQAALALRLTPSGVSQHLTKLEAEAGVPLVDRSRPGGGRPLRLTEAGRALADQAEQLAAALASAEREVDRYKEQRRGTVRVGGFPTVLARLAAPAVVALALTDPGIEPRIDEVEEADGLRRLRRGVLDLLLSDAPVGSAHERPRGLRETALLEDPYRIVVPATWADDDPATLLARPWVLPRQQTASRRALERVATSYGITLDVRHHGVQSGTMLALVAGGLGAAIIPQLTLSMQLTVQPSSHPSGQARVYDGPLEPGARTLTVLHPDVDDPPAVERFVEELRRQAGALRTGS